MALHFSYDGRNFALDRTDVLSRIRCRLLSSEFYKGIDKLIKTGLAADIYRTYAIYLDSTADGVAMIPVTYALAEACSLTLDDLEKAAAENSRYKIQSLGTLLDLPWYDDTLIAVSTPDLTNGAAAILDKRAQQEICKKLGNRFYIIPSSIHEVLVTAADTLRPSDIVDMIKDVNKTMVSPAERLSDHLFVYESGNISVAA